MDIVFERVDDRRYRIGAVRNGRYDVGGDVPVRSGPGHAEVPHDLVHFVVEEQARLTLGIYGQVAAGADLGGFFRSAPGSRRSVGEQRRSRRLGRAGRPDVAESERLAACVDGRGHVAAAAPMDPRLRLRIQVRLDDVLTRWRATPHGDRLVLTWPDALTVRHGAGPTRRRR